MDPNVANGYADRLRQQDNAYGSAPVAGQKNAVPEGEYQAVINRFDYIDTAKGLKLKTEMLVAVGDFKGAELECWHDLEDPEKHKYLKQHLMALGLDLPPSLAELDGCLKHALDCPVHVRVVERGGYKNAYVQSRLGEPIAQGAQNTGPLVEYENTYVPTDDDVPF